MFDWTINAGDILTGASMAGALLYALRNHATRSAREHTEQQRDVQELAGTTQRLAESMTHMAEQMGTLAESVGKVEMSVGVLEERTEWLMKERGR